MSQINVSDLSFYYDGSYDMIFEHVSFQVDTDWKLGFVGRNGRGKTTFLKLLMGQYEYQGKISSSVEFEYFPYEVTDKEKLGVEILEEIDPNHEFWMVCRELTLLNVDPEVLYRPFSTLSNGEQTKVMLGILFARENSFLLIDEPTNHLDMEARKSVMEYLKQKKGFILVSHDRYFLDGCVDHILSLNKTNIEVMQGNFSSWWEQKQRRDESERAENEKLKKDVVRLTQAAKRTENWSNDIEKTKYGTRTAGLRPDRGHIGHQSAKMMKRALTSERRANEALEEKQKLLKNIESADSLKIIPLRHHKDPIITAEDLSVYYDDHMVFEHLNMTVRNGQRVILQGKNGCGKSSLLKLILGEAIPYSGRLELASGLRISYVSQDTSYLAGSLETFAETAGIDGTLFKTILRKLDFSRVQFDKPMESYSGGQKKKVLLAKSLCEQAHLYIWDEPLNFVDLFSRIQIEELLKEYQPTMLLVEHDKRFVEEVATDVVRF